MSDKTPYEQIKEGLEDAIGMPEVIYAYESGWNVRGGIKHPDQPRPVKYVRADEVERLKNALRFYANEENGHKARLVLLGDKNE